MKGRCLCRRWGQHIALALEFPTLANVIGHLCWSTPLNGHCLRVVGFEHQTDVDDRSFKSPHVFDIERADDYPLNFLKPGRVSRPQVLAGDIAEIGRELIKRVTAVAAGVVGLSVKRVGEVSKNNFREVRIEFPQLLKLTWNIRGRALMGIQPQYG